MEIVKTNEALPISPPSWFILQEESDELWESNRYKHWDVLIRCLVIKSIIPILYTEPGICYGICLFVQIYYICKSYISVDKDYVKQRSYSIRYTEKL